MREIAGGVFELGFGYVNAFVVVDESVTLVDSGTPKKKAKLERAVAEVGKGRPLRDIVVTHHHMDHVGSLADVAPESVTVWAHPLDAGVIKGTDRPKPAPRNALERLGVGVDNRLVPNAKPARVDRELSDGEHIPVAGGLIA